MGYGHHEVGCSATRLRRERFFGSVKVIIGIGAVKKKKLGEKSLRGQRKSPDPGYYSPWGATRPVSKSRPSPRVRVRSKPFNGFLAS